MKKRLRLSLVGVASAAALALAAGPLAAQEKDHVRVALSAFQDVNSIYVGIAQGFFSDENIELDIQNTDWPGANELLIGEHVDIATSSDADIVLQNARGIDTTLAFPLFYFAGGGLMFDPQKHNWKTLDEFLAANGNDMTAGIRSALEQAKGARVGVSSGGAEYAAFIEMLTVAGLDPKDYQIVDLAQEELPPALLSGSIDIQIAGIPQRLAVLRQGYKTLMDQTAVPSTVAHAGFAAHRAWVDQHFDLAVRLERAILRSLAYIEQNPDAAFPIISGKLHEAGTEVSAQDLKGVWNNMEFFPNSVDWYEKNVVSPDGRFYWKARFESVVKNLKTEGRITDLKVPLEDLNYGLKVVPATAKQ